MKTLRDILIGTILGALCAFGGVWGYDRYHQYQQEQQEAALQKEQARRHHRDSLMQIRQAQEQQERAENRKEIEQRVVMKFLKEFYDDVIFDDDYPSDKYKQYLTAHCLKKLKDAYRMDCPDGNCLAWWLFRPSGQDLDMESMEKHFRVTPEDDNWYRVHFVSNGATEFKYVKILVDGNIIHIDDVK